MNKYFYCYSYPLKEFLIHNGEQFILYSVHDVTKKRFWVFDGNKKLNNLLNKWRLSKK